MTLIDPSEWCTVRTAATLAGVNRPRVYVLVGSGRIRSVRIDGTIFANRADALAWRARSPRRGRPPLPIAVRQAGAMPSQRPRVRISRTTTPAKIVRRRRASTPAPTTATSSTTSPAEPGAPDDRRQKRPAGGARNRRKQAENRVR